MAHALIRATPLDLKPFRDLTAFAQQYPARVRAVTRSEFAAPTGEPALLQALSVEPGTQAASPWGGWSSDPVKNARARRMYFYLIKTGLIQTDGKHYLRSHALSQGYAVTLLFEGAAGVVAVRNTANRAYRYTKGNRQIPGHLKTGWGKDAPIIQAWARDFIAAVVAGLRTVKAVTT